MEAIGGEHQGRTTSIRKVALASLIGTAIEWYDYFLYGTAAALVFGQLFFPGFSPVAGTLASFATFAVGFGARPVGGIVFGHFGDRVGRKTMLVVSILIMGLATFLIGLLPTFDSIGIWAPILLVTLRIFQGFAVGGEWGGATLMAMEHAPANKRGFYTTWPQMGVSVGLLLGTSIIYLFALLPEEQFLAWGWRFPFLLSLVLVIVGVYIRLKIMESPSFRRLQEAGSQARVPLGEVLRDYKMVTLLVIGAQCAVNVCFYVFTTWSISYLTGQLGLSTAAALSAVMIAAALDFFAQALFGAWSDKIGRRPIYLAGSAFFGLFAFPFFWLLNTGSVFLIVVALVLGISLGHGATYSTQASFFAEQFGTRVRYSGVSFGYQLAGTLWSGPAPFVAAALLAWTGSVWAISLFMVLASIVSVISIYLASETFQKDIDEVEPRQGDTVASVSRNSGGGETV